MRLHRISPGSLSSALAGLAILGLTIVAGIPPAHAISVKAGKWSLSFDGNVNAHYIFSHCQSLSNAHDITNVGGACVTSTRAGGGSSSVSNGLLPAALTIGGSTTQDGYDIGFTFGLYPGISTNDGGSPNIQTGACTSGTVNPSGGVSLACSNFLHTALGTAGLDIRQVFLTVGNKTMGTIMAGRNIGLFQSDAILNDMTLLGVGGGNGDYAAPANTSLGSIGLGYIYTDWLSQIDYTTPNLSGTKITVGIFDPLNTLGQIPVNHSSPGFQAKVAYKAGPLYLSASGMYQRQAMSCADPALNANACAVGSSELKYSSSGVDIGGMYTMGPFQAMGWYYRAKGIGTTGLFVLSNDLMGMPRTSEGFIAQLTYTVGKTKFGVNYGQSKLDPTANDLATPTTLLAGTAMPTLVRKNDKWTAGVYHHLTHDLMLVGEFSRIRSFNDLGQENASWNINAGLFLSF